MDTETLITETKSLVEDFLTQMGLDAEITVSVETEAEKDVHYVYVKLEGENLGELVGFHGKNLQGSQVILGMMLSKRIGKEQRARLVLEINDYKEKREKYLVSYAQRAAMQVRESAQEMELTPMKPDERRIVHMALKTETGISTSSIGEEPERRIVITPN